MLARFAGVLLTVAGIWTGLPAQAQIVPLIRTDQGMVDELSLYNRALSTQEIEGIYRDGSSGKCATSAAPTIVTPPASQTRFVGQSVTFSVGACGTPPLRYQWMLDGSGIAGAINASLVLTNVRASDAGRYQVMLSNTAGSAASIDAILTVLPVRPDSYCASSPDGTFSTALNPDEWSDVQALAVQADGRILAGGTVRAGVCGLVRFNIDGSRDTRFAPRLTGHIFALAVQPDGKLVVGGEFDLPDGGPFGLARLNVDGSLDVTFAPGSIDESGPVLAVTLLSNGQVLAGGRFGQFGGVRGNRVVRLHSDGSRDTTFDADRAEFCGGVQALLAQADGRVLLGLESWNCPASTRRGLVRLNADGSLDPTFSADIREPVQRLVAQPDGRFLAAGDFVAVNGLVRPGLVRLNADGVLDESFVLSGAAFHSVSALAVLSDGRIVAGGESTEDTWRQTVVVLDSNGSRDPNFQALFDYDDNDPAVWTLAVQPDGQLLVGGEFGDVNGTSQFLVARLQGRSQICPGFVSFGAARFYCGETDGSLTLTLHRSEGATGQLAVNYATVNGEALAGADYQRQTGTVVFAEGQTERTITVPLLDDTLREANERFAVQVTAGTNSQPFLDGQPLKATVVMVDDENAARLGSVERTFSASIPVSFRGGTPVTGAVLQPDGKILFGGDFEVINGTSRPHLARLMADGSIDTSFDAPLVRHGSVLALAVQPDGRVLVGGWFSPAGIARLLPDGQADSSFDPGTGIGPWITISVILLQPDGKVMIGGQFSSVDGHPRQSIARLNADGSVDAEFAATGATWAVGGAAYVWALALQADGKVVLGGGFHQVNGEARTSLARLNADGSLDQTFRPPLATNAYVYALVVAPDGKLLVGGSFIVSGLQHRNLVRLNPDGSVDPTFQASVDGYRYSGVSDVALQPDGKLIVAGSFQFINGVNQPYLARLNPDGSSDRDFFIGAGPNGSVGSVQVQPDGQVLVAGSFATFDNLPHPYLVRLNGDSPPVAPTITQQPESITRYFGETATFSVIATGTPPLTYQWWFNGQALPDAVSATLTLPNVRPAQAGAYWVRVSNSAGAATSAVVTLTVSDGTNCVAAPPGLVAWWRAEGNASDVVGGQPGQLINNVSFASGRVGQAFAFDGRSYVEVPDAPSLRLENALTIEFWVRRERLDQVHYIIEKGGDWTRGQQNYAVALHTGAYNHCLHFLFAGGWRGGGSIADTNWHHCAVVARDGDTDPVLYIDGAPQPIVYGEGAPTIRLNPSTRPLHLGAQIDPQSGWFYYHQGLIDELSLYNRALSAQEITAVYRAGSHGKCATGAPPSCVRREILRPTVQLVATPPTTVSVYAVEDQVHPPAVIAHISHGGVFDAATGKVKFGPFYDHEPRTLSYSVVIPPGCIHGVCGRFTFTGTASADGVNSPIAGDALMLVAGLHPADLASADSQLSIGEVTAYGAAWRRGETWPVPPVPIAIDYVTRAAFLWRGGECYQVDPVATNAPLCWVDCGAPRGADSPSAVAQVSQPPGAQRRMAGAFVPGEPLVVTLAVSPAAARAYAVEEQSPPGWTVVNITDGGELDALNGKVKWGPFLDNTPRALSYVVTPPASANGMVLLSGNASFDGVSVTVAGAQQLEPSCRLGASVSPQGAGLRLELTGARGAVFVIEASSDLVLWTPLVWVTNTLGRVEFVDPAGTHLPQRFYRAKPNP